MEKKVDNRHHPAAEAGTRQTGTTDRTFRDLSATGERVASEFIPESTTGETVYTLENAVRMLRDAPSQDKKTMLPVSRNMGIWLPTEPCEGIWTLVRECTEQHITMPKPEKPW